MSAGFDMTLVFVMLAVCLSVSLLFIIHSVDGRPASGKKGPFREVLIEHIRHRILGAHMAVRLRLARMGRKKNPFYRIVAADQRAPRDGRFIERLGYYDPMKDPVDLKVDLERVDYWMGVGASPSETVASLIKKARASAEG